jgi:zinc transport system substrate-binding protein
MRKMSLLLVLCLVWMGGCSQSEEDTAVSSQPEQKPIVYVSNYPLQYFVERVAPWVEVRFPADVSGDPAYWKPNAQDVSAMQKADVIVLNGASYETWFKNVSLAQTQLLDTSAGLRDRFIPLEEHTTHSHGLEGEHEHSGIAFTLWLDMTLALAQVQAISADFSTRWPERAAGIEQAAAALMRDLQSLDDEMKTIVSAASGQPVLFSHPVYQYLQKRYGINGKSVHWEPDVMPDDQMWQELTGLVDTHPAKWMIWEGDPEPEIEAKLVVIGIQSVVFDPCAGKPEQGDFLSVMQKNATALQTVYNQQ